MKLSAIAFAAIIGWPNGLLAGPDATTQHLISDPTSMMDLGMFKLDMLLESRGLGFAGFEWETNRITIFAPFEIGGGEEDLAKTEIICANWINQIRVQAGVDVETGQVRFGRATVFSEEFSHSGFVRKSEPETLYEDLDRLFVLQCFAFPGDLMLTVTAPLLGTTYAVEKKKKVKPYP